MIEIRNYQASDYQVVREILEKGNLFYDVCDSENNLERTIKQEPDSILVAVENGKVIGTVCTVSGFIPFIFRLAVHPNYRNRGIGMKLMQSAEQVLKKKGHSHGNILVDANDTELQKMYERHGYERGHTYVWMEKKL